MRVDGEHLHHSASNTPEERGLGTSQVSTTSRATCGGGGYAAYARPASFFSSCVVSGPASASRRPLCGARTARRSRAEVLRRGYVCAFTLCPEHHLGSRIDQLRQPRFAAAAVEILACGQEEVCSVFPPERDQPVQKTVRSRNGWGPHASRGVPDHALTAKRLGVGRRHPYSGLSQATNCREGAVIVGDRQERRRSIVDPRIAD